MGVAGDVDDAGDGRIVFGQFQQPIFVDVRFPRPDVPVAGLGPNDAGGVGFALGIDAPTAEQAQLDLPLGVGERGAQRIFVGSPPLAKRFVLGKGRVNANQVDALVVEAAEEGQVVADIDAAVDGVETASHVLVVNHD